MKMLWKDIKSVVTMNPDNLNTIAHLTDVSSSQIKDLVEMANQFNHCFTSAANSITKNIPRNPRPPLSYLTNPNQNSFFIYPCTPDEEFLLRA